MTRLVGNGKSIAKEDSLGNAVSYSYDGNRTGKKDQDGYTTRFTYDACGQLIRAEREERTDT